MCGKQRIKKIHGMVEQVKDDGKASVEYMKIFEKEKMLKEQGRRQGLEEGLEQGREEERQNTERERQRADQAEAELEMLRAELNQLKSK